MTEPKNNKRPRISQREIDILTRAKLREAGDKPKYGFGLKLNYTPVELKTFNKWRRIRRDKGDAPENDGDLCAICGLAWPEWFFVSSEEWARYVPPDKRGATICRACYDDIQKTTHG